MDVVMLPSLQLLMRIQPRNELDDVEASSRSRTTNDSFSPLSVGWGQDKDQFQIESFTSRGWAFKSGRKTSGVFCLSPN